MLNFTKQMHECTGCRACEAICPKKSITLIEDSEGFLYPNADDSCIQCGLCNKVCPTFNSSYYGQKNFESFTIAAKHKNEDVWFKSTSGGAFTGICESLQHKNAVVFGAVYDHYNVIHASADSIDEIDKFRKSKYVQSDLKGLHEEIYDLLNKNRNVIFSGTPCQIAGLKNFLGKEYDGLFTIDLICHGVGSPRVFRQYLEKLEKTYSERVLSYSFRNKRIKGQHLSEYITRVEFESGLIIEDSNDLYNRGFLQALFLRPSCGECKFANVNRVGDLTIADLKKKFDLLPNYREAHNLSAIIVNSEKGKLVYEKLTNYMNVYHIDYDSLVESNNPLRKPSKMSENRGVFFEELASGKEINEVLKKYVGKPSLKIKLWSLIPDRTRSMLRRKMKWIKKLL